MARLELAASWSQTTRPTNWATSGCEPPPDASDGGALPHTRDRVHPTVSLTEIVGGSYSVHTNVSLTNRALEPKTGIEPAIPAWEAGVLPLHHLGRFRREGVTRRAKHRTFRANILRIGERSTRRLIDEAQDFLVQNDDGSFVLNTEYF